MRKTGLNVVLGVVLGVIITLILVFVMLPKKMMLEDVSKYDFDETIVKLEESIIANDWKIVAKHDLQASMKKFGHDVSQVVVYELCHPDHAMKILQENDERIVSSLMPCRVSIYMKDDGKVYVSRMNSGLMAKTMSKIIRTVMADASSQNEDILDAILN